MGVIKVDVYPPDGRGPVRISTDLTRDAQTVFDTLAMRYGDGTLWDHNGCLVGSSKLPDQARQLDAGDYTFFKNAQGRVETREGAAAAAITSALQGITVAIKQLAPEEPAVEQSLTRAKAFHDASIEEARHAANLLGLTICNGPDMEALVTPPGTPECDSFPLGNFQDIDAATPSLVAYHTQNLAKMGVPMEEGGLCVLDVHKRKRLLAVYAGERWHIDGIDCVAVRRTVQKRDAAEHIEVGFVHHREDKQASRAAAQCSQGNPYGDFETAPLAQHFPQMIMTMLAAVAMNRVLLDLLVTDGTHFTLYRVREENIFVYEDLTPTQAYHALAVALKQYDTAHRPVSPVRTQSGAYVMTETTYDPKIYQPHHTLMDKLEDYGVWPDSLKSHTDSMASLSSSW